MTIQIQANSRIEDLHQLLLTKCVMIKVQLFVSKNFRVLNLWKCQLLHLTTRCAYKKCWDKHLIDIFVYWVFAITNWFCYCKLQIMFPSGPQMYKYVRNRSFTLLKYVTEPRTISILNIYWAYSDSMVARCLLLETCPRRYSVVHNFIPPLAFAWKSW